MAKKIDGLSSKAYKFDNNDIVFVKRNLDTIRVQAERAKRYLDENDWSLIESLKDREDEFNLQAIMTDKLMSWNESYIKMSGIMESFEKSFNNDKPKKKSNFVSSGIEDLATLANSDEDIARELL